VTLRPLFGWFSPKLIRKIFENTTQYARIEYGTLLKLTFKSTNPALNVTYGNELVSCDIIYNCNTNIHAGSFSVVLRFGIYTQTTDVNVIKTDKWFVKIP
jgi:hypothetical protein